jgi:trans-aconitate methyltransferase
MAKDHWSAEKYSSAAGFVPQLTTKVLSYLDVQANERILDLGCGDGRLTAQIAQSTAPGEVLGLDASQSFISTAQQQFSSANCTFGHQDCTKLEQRPEAVNGSWDKVFSNAAMHWILRNPDIRMNYLKNVNKALKQDGKFVFEMGANGNCAEVQAAATAALLHAGVPLDKAREANPWFFPSTVHMSNLLDEAGFNVELCEHEYRSTQLTADTDDKSGGLEGWVKLMCAPFLEHVAEDKREVVTREICDVIDPIITRHEDGSKWMGYCRLRAIARKK